MYLNHNTNLWYSHSTEAAYVRRKRCCENMQQIYRRTPTTKCDFNKVVKQLYWNHTSAWVLSYKLAAYFQNTFPKNTPEPLHMMVVHKHLNFSLSSASILIPPGIFRKFKDFLKISGGAKWQNWEEWVNVQVLFLPLNWEKKVFNQLSQNFN